MENSSELTISFQIKQAILQSLSGVFSSQRAGLHMEDIHLEHPADENHGDFATNLALAFLKKNSSQLAKENIKNPLELAQAISQKIKLDFIKKIEVVKPGFINFWLTEDFLFCQLEEAIAKKGNYGRREANGQKIMVEFAHPNTHKLFHIGHLRNITLGESICRILEFGGYTIFRTNYQGDVGMHIAKCLWAIINTENYREEINELKTLDQKINFLGQAYTVGNKAYETDEKAKIEIHRINEKIYTRDREIYVLWKQTRQWSLDYFDRIYRRLYTSFNRLYFESEVWESGKKIVLMFLKKGVFEKSEGAIIFRGEKYGLHNRVFINSQGLPTYEAKDMGLGNLQFNDWQTDRYIHIVGPEQSGYFEVVFKALEFVKPEMKGKEYHRSYGWVRLKEGKMSSRAGNVVTGESLLEEAEIKLSSNFKFDFKEQDKERILEEIAIGAVKYSMLKYSPETEFVFDMQESISLDGNSGPYLQYTHARCLSVLEKAKLGNDLQKTGLKFERLEAAEKAILRKIYLFPEVVYDAAQRLSPNIICNYLYDLAQKYNLFYNEYPILRAEKKIKIFRVKLTLAVNQLLENGLFLLGIKAPEKM